MLKHINIIINVLMLMIIIIIIINVLMLRVLKRSTFEMHYN